MSEKRITDSTSKEEQICTPLIEWPDGNKWPVTSLRI